MSRNPRACCRGPLAIVVTALVLALGVECTSAGEESTPAKGQPPVNYNRDIRPLLSNTCYTCHGPDEAERQAGLRLDRRDVAFAELDSGATAIVPGDSAASELYRRITSDDPWSRMPPEDHEKQLTPEQIESIRLWIDQGAPWGEHWSFIPPERPTLPEVQADDWPRHPIDRFVLRRLEEEGLRPSPEADKVTLLRRVTFDLTGLPPTPDEIDAFLADSSPEAYERVVDRLLASRRYGEHMARFWLDAARYGDTHGLHLDNERVIWPYRNWVIDAFNANMPFDQFTIEQLAGDLLPEPTLDQVIATGFNRCNVTTSEGGSIDEEYYVRYAVDRVETTGTVFMGLSLGCAACHDHKYDPISQREFYGLFAFFNSLTEKAMDGNAPAPPPVVKVPSEQQRAAMEELEARIAEVRQQLNGPQAELDAAQLAWEAELRDQTAGRWQILEPVEYASAGGATLRKLDDQSLLAEGNNPDRDVYEIAAPTGLEGIVAVRLEALTDDSLPHTGPGRSSNANFVLSEFEMEVAPLSDSTQFQRVRFAHARADHSQTNGEYFIEKAIDGIVDATNGWAVSGFERRENRTAIFTLAEPIALEGGALLRFRLRHESHFTQHAIGRVRLSVSTDPATAPVTLGTWHQIGPFTREEGGEVYDVAFGPVEAVELDASYDDGKLQWVQRPDLADGTIHPLEGEYAATYLYRTIHAPSPRKLTLSLGSDDGLKVWHNDRVVLDRNVQRGAAEDQDRVVLDLATGENRILLKVVNASGSCAFYFKALDDDLGGELAELLPIVALPADERSAAQQKQLRDYFRSKNWDQWSALQAKLTELGEEKKSLDREIPTSMVMKELDEPKPAYVLIRGEYDKKGDPVERHLPAVLPPLPEGAPLNRLGLAQWLVDPGHPLTARVTVNRLWQQFFGTGLVKTSEDFGSQGEWPSHPELLDWLATEFIASGWNVKDMVKAIVTSATYRQSSTVSEELLRRDRDNRLLARGPRYRLDAETIRDNALAVSGLLVEGEFGRGAKPYQPPGLWEAVGYTSSNTARFTRDDGDALYRRSIYTFWKRTAPPPYFLIFDAPSREACTVRRPRTNTPLQALLLMNDEQHVEAARHLAQRAMLEGGAGTAQRVQYAFRLATARFADDDELAVLLQAYQAQLEIYQADPEAAAALLEVGESPYDQSLSPVELAAWTMVANLILNLDETVTKG